MKKNNKGMIDELTLIIIGGIVTIVLIMALLTIRKVDTGEIGIRTNFGKVVEDDLKPGVHLKAPWQKIICLDSKVQKCTLEMDSTTSDMQDVKMSYTLNYRINAASAGEIYSSLGTNYQEKVIEPQITNTVKSVVAQYEAIQLVSERAEVASTTEKELEEALRVYNIQVVDSSVENMDFSKEFDEAIEAKVVAEQQLEQAKTEQEKLNLETEQEAERKKTAAEGQAEANRILAESLNDQVLSKQMLDTWNGELPKVVVGNDSFEFSFNK